MSRRSMFIEVGGTQAEVIVGWDPPLREFFGQVWIGEDEDAPRISAAGRMEAVRRALGKWDPPNQVWDLVQRDEARDDADTVSTHGRRVR